MAVLPIGKSTGKGLARQRPVVGRSDAPRRIGGRVVAVIAAHNEESCIGATLQSLAEQTRRPDEVFVVADRCSDRTAEIARSFGARVFETSGNRHRKAGALNQALAVVIADLEFTDQVLLMDADTILCPGFLAAAERRLSTRDDGRPEIGAVGAVFLADSSW